MSDIQTLLKNVKKYSQDIENRLLDILKGRRSITQPESESIRKFLGFMEKANIDRSKFTGIYDPLFAKLQEEEGEGEESEEEEGAEAEEVKGPKAKPRKAAVATTEEKDLIKSRLAIKAEAIPVYDKGELDTFCKKSEVNFGEFDEIKKIMKEVMFLGFRWVDVFSKLRKRAKDAGIPKEIFIYHMRFFCAIYVERGSAYLWRGLPSLKNKAMRVYINAMIKVYDVVKKRPVGGYGPDDATITRIVAIFPDLVAQVIKDASKTPIAADVSPGIKFWFKFPGGASLIPKDKVEEYKAWLTWYRAFGKVINRGTEPSEADVKRYGDAIHNSDVSSDTRRNEVWLWA